MLFVVIGLAAAAAAAAVFVIIFVFFFLLLCFFFFLLLLVVVMVHSCEITKDCLLELASRSTKTWYVILRRHSQLSAESGDHLHQDVRDEAGNDNTSTGQDANLPGTRLVEVSHAHQPDDVSGRGQR